MGLFDKLREPVVLKSDSDAQEQLRQLTACQKSVSPADKAQLELDIKFAKYGIEGEKSVLFELKNSHMPMYILHDVYLKYDKLSAQIDFLVITKKFVLVLECKNLYGNISIDKQGNFNRITEADGKKHREGMYNPYTQNQRHLEMIREMRRAEKNILLRGAFDRHFPQSHKSLIVLANPKTIISMNNAPEEIQNQVVKADNLINHIKKMHEANLPEMSDKEMKALADFFMKHHQKNPVDYAAKYKKQAKPQKPAPKKAEYSCPHCQKPVIKGKYGFYCTAKCGMRLDKVYGTPLEEKQIISLLNGKSITCVTKTGKTTVLPQAVKNTYQGKTSWQWKTELKK